MPTMIPNGPITFAAIIGPSTSITSATPAKLK